MRPNKDLDLRILSRLAPKKTVPAPTLFTSDDLPDKATRIIPTTTTTIVKITSSECVKIY